MPCSHVTIQRINFGKMTRFGDQAKISELLRRYALWESFSNIWIGQLCHPFCPYMVAHVWSHALMHIAQFDALVGNLSKKSCDWNSCPLHLNSLELLCEVPCCSTSLPAATKFSYPVTSISLLKFKRKLNPPAALQSCSQEKAF